MLSRNKTVNPKCDVILRNEAIQRVTKARLLGVIVDKHLNREGVNGIAKKSKSCGIISRIQNILDIKSKKKCITVSYIPIYCVNVWSSTCRTNLKKL